MVLLGDVDPDIAGVADGNDDVDDNNDELPGELDNNNDDVELPGVNTGADDDDQQPPTDFEHEIEVDEPNIVEPEQALPIEHVPVANEPVPAVVEQPTATRRSTRVRKAPQQYVPTMTGNKYQYAAAQLAQGVLYPDAHMFVQEDFYQHDIDVIETVMTQLSLKAALKEWGNDANKAAYSEAKQLHWRNSFKAVHHKDLTAEQRLQILESHMIVVQKKDGTVKAREVAGGNKQRNFVLKEDASSPTAATESVLLLSCAVDAKERRQTAILDIPNAFIQTRVEREKDRAIVRITGLVADMLVKIAPEVYSKYVTKDKRGNSELIVICLNALYGTMVAALLLLEPMFAIHCCFHRLMSRSGVKCC